MNHRVDAHQHFWRPARGDYTWLRADVPSLAPIVRDFLPQHLQPSLAAHRVKQTVLVQAADSEAETDFMLTLADSNEMIGGVVGWVDLARPQAVATLERWARNPRFKGVRPMLQDLPDNDWIAHAPHPDVIRALVRLGLRFDALVQPWHLEPLLRFVKAWPELPVVIDHAAKPQLARWPRGWDNRRINVPTGEPVSSPPSNPRSGEVADWQRGMARLAEHPQVMCKFSGLMTEAPTDARASPAAAVAVLEPVWDRLLAWFGPQRLMWGSDWPVLTLAAGYDAWVAVGDTLIGALAPDEQAQVWHHNACRFYGLATEAG